MLRSIRRHFSNSSIFFFCTHPKAAPHFTIRPVPFSLSSTPILPPLSGFDRKLVSPSRQARALAADNKWTSFPRSCPEQGIGGEPFGPHTFRQPFSPPRQMTFSPLPLRRIPNYHGPRPKHILTRLSLLDFPLLPTLVWYIAQEIGSISHKDAFPKRHRTLLIEGCESPFLRISPLYIASTCSPVSPPFPIDLSLSIRIFLPLS